MPAILSARPIVQALHDVGIEAESEQVEFVGTVPASDSVAGVRITGWRKLNADTVWVRLMCRRAQDCLPFYILLHPSDRAAIPTVGTPVLASQFAVNQLTPAQKKRTASLVRAGSRAVLLLSNGAAHIRTAVICLESGERGGRIRVRNLATKRILSAQIIDRGLVQAWF